MRRVFDAAGPARHALLGLLLLDGPSHGYDLARHFAPDSALGDVLYLGPSHLYALLTRLEKDGLIVGERQDSPSRPPRRVYQLTDAGRATVLRWLDEPVPRPREMHLDFPLKLYIARRRDPARAALLVSRQRALLESHLRRLERVGRAITEYAVEEEETFIALMREGRIARTRAALDWLDRCARVVGSQ